MKTYYCRVFGGVLCGLICVILKTSTAYAVDFQDRYNSTLAEINTFLGDTGQERLSVSASTDVPATPEYVGFNATVGEMLVNGGINRQIGGHALYVKLLFLRGSYDSYTQTYKTILALSVEDTTADLMGRLIPIGSNQDFGFGNLNLHVEFAGQTALLRNNNVSTETVTLQYSDLSSTWASNASAYCAAHLSGTYCFIPQYYWDGISHYGYVVSANTPLYYTTNFPQDFVELYKLVS